MEEEPKERGKEVSDEIGPFIVRTDEGPVYKGWDEVPAEALIENTRRGNMEAWNALLKSVGMTEEEFTKKVAENVLEELKDIIKDDNSDETVE